MKIGVDPGVSGAVVLLGKDNELISFCDMPTMANGKHQQVNAAELAKVISSWLVYPSQLPVTAYLEQVAAMPGQGVSSMFGFGCSYGIVQGVLGALEIPMVLVPPQKWKRAAGLPARPKGMPDNQYKDMARTLAQRLYPKMPLSLKKHIGRADAILIARFG